MNEIELKNYRCFPVGRKARFAFGPGFTAIVGQNNAGKSSLLRLFWEYRNLWLRLSAGNRLADLTESQWGETQGTIDREEVFSNLNRENLHIRIAISDWVYSPEDEYPPPDELNIEISRDDPTQAQLTWVLRGHPIQRFVWETNQIMQVSGSRYSIKPYARLFGELAQSVYVGPFRNALNAAGATHYDIEIGHDFINSWARFKSGPSKAENRAAIRLTDELRRIFGFESLEINPTNEGTSMQVNVDGQPYRLDELGAGLAQFLITLAFVAVRNPPYVFIDEPELNLHPSLQLDFLTTLASFAKGGVIFGTHSLGLARAANGGIYSVQRNGPGESEVNEFESTPNLSELLGELSFSGYQALGSSTVLLVEGKHEVLAFQRILRLYGSEHRIAIVSLAGTNLINAESTAELDELRRLSDDIWVVIDSERRSASEALSAGRQGFAENCQKLGFEVCVLERRAFENYLPDSAVKAVKGEVVRALKPYETLKEASSPWAKAENWRIAGHLQRVDLEGTDLGQFFERLTADREAVQSGR
jgi:ABC-type cobalamin/Fe3+-siderophores transport system ATPase subunit